jgi:hypothetical protein
MRVASFWTRSRFRRTQANCAAPAAGVYDVRLDELTSGPGFV